jgi:hypothetical protein
VCHTIVTPSSWARLLRLLVHYESRPLLRSELLRQVRLGSPSVCAGESHADF